MHILLALYSLSFFCLAWQHWRRALMVFIVLLPTYLIRFELFHIGKYPFPSTLLEVTWALLCLAWLFRYSREDSRRIVAVMQNHKVFFVAVGIFFLSSVVSIFVSDMVFYSLGEWRAYFLEPVILFVMLLGRQEMLQRYDLLWALIFSTLSISIFSVIQKFTGWGIATPEWAAVATRRVTAFYTSPNAVGLYLAPLILIMFVLVMKSWQPVKKFNAKTPGLLGVSAIALLALAFTKSQGAWIGLGAGLLVFLFCIGFRKLTIGLAVVGVIFSLAVPSMRQAVLFQDQANKNRLRLWEYSWTFLSASPKNFILGTGVRQFFRKIQKPYYDKYVMERLIYPHNIFLNFWTEIGLAGALAVSSIIGYAGYLANKIRKIDKITGAGLLGALVVLVVHGLVDVPYFKNDLAFFFWILIASIMIVYAYLCESKTVST